MANDIGNFFNSEPDKEGAVDRVFEHLRKEIIKYHKEGGSELNEPVRLAVTRLEMEQS